MQTNDVVKAMKCCRSDDCYRCPYHSIPDCSNVLRHDCEYALYEQANQIQRLEKTVELLTKAVEAANKFTDVANSEFRQHSDYNQSLEQLVLI